MKNDVVIVISNRNKFDKDGESTNNLNHTEVDIYENGKKLTNKIIGGTQYRLPELVGKAFTGEKDSLGFFKLKSYKGKVDAEDLLDDAIEFNPKELKESVSSFSDFLKSKTVSTLDEANLNESSNKRISADKFSKIGKIAFGLLSVDSSSGRSTAKDLADVSQAKILIDKLPKKKLFSMLVQAGAEIGLDLVPVDGADSNGFVGAGGGGEDCIALKLKGNDYSDNDLDGDFQADLVFALEQLTIGSGI